MAFDDSTGDEREPLIPPEGETEPDETEPEAAELEEAEAETIRELEEAEEEALAAAHGEYLRAVHFHFGDTAPILPCPTCQTRGYVMAALADDPQAEQCPACVGLGIVRTGSLVEGNVTRPCPRCSGAGFVNKVDTSSPPVEPVAPPAGVTILPPSAFPPAPAPVEQVAS